MALLSLTQLSFGLPFGDHMADFGQLFGDNLGFLNKVRSTLSSSKVAARLALIN